MTVFFIPNADDKEVNFNGKTYHTSIWAMYVCDMKGCKIKNLLQKKEVASCGGKHFCLDCAKIFCEENNIAIVTNDVKKIGKAIRKKIPMEKNMHNPFRYKTLFKLEKYLTKDRLMKGIKYRTLKIDVFGNPAFGSDMRKKIVNHFDLVEEKSNGYTVFYSREGYEAFKKEKKLLEKPLIQK